MSSSSVKAFEVAHVIIEPWQYDDTGIDVFFVRKPISDDGSLYFWYLIVLVVSSMILPYLMRQKLHSYSFPATMLADIPHQHH